MKIGIQTPIAPLLHHRQNIDPTIDFDALVSAPITERQADDDYWQHQDQLQPSELTFNPLEKTRSALIPLGKPNPESCKPTIIQTDAQNDIAGPQPLDYLTEQGSPALPTKNISEPIAELDITLMQWVLAKEQEITQKPLSSVQNLKTLHAEPLKPNALFKNYLLFVDKNVVELTMNTTQLTPDDIQTLQKLIKQWMQQKGYTLKQLIFNGVPQ